MSGIAVVVSQDNALKNQAQGMIEKVLHRGNSILKYEDANISIINCVRAREKISSIKYFDKFILAFDGEIYNYDELSDLVEVNNKSDQAIFLSLYEKFGTACMDKINGIFSYVLFDIEKNKIVFAKDRFGVKPLYYTFVNNNLCIASEIKEFIAISEFCAIGNQPRIRDFLLFNAMDHSSQTLFKDVYQLRAGELFEYDLTSKNLNSKKWYDLCERVVSSDICLDEAKQRFKELFSRSINIRLKGEKVGALLSGGMDSSSIVCVADELLNQSKKKKLETVSVCFEEEHVNEIEYIDAVVDETDVVSHRVYPKQDGLLQVLDKIAYQLDEPYASTSIYAQYCAYEESSKQGLEIILDGQGSDEMLAGYIGSVHNIYFEELYAKKEFERLNANIEGYKKHYGIDYKVNKKRSFLLKTFPIKFLRKMRAMLLRKPGDYHNYVKIKDDGKFFETSGRRVKSLLDASLKFFNYSSVPLIFRYEDRDSAIHGMDYRVPFVDHNFVEFVLSLPSEYIIHEGKTKYILREALKDTLPEKIYTRYSKLGFESPEDVWIRENREFFRSEIEKTCDLMGKLLKKKKILKWFDKTTQSGTKFRYEFWKLISLGRWIKAFDIKFN